MTRHDRVGRYFHQWSEHERTLAQSRMWNDQVRLPDHAVSVERDIQIQAAWRVRKLARAPMSALDREQSFEQFARRESCHEHGYRIHEIGLLEISHRRVAVKGRSPRHGRLRQRGETARCTAELRGRIIEVAA